MYVWYHFTISIHSPFYAFDIKPKPHEIKAKYGYGTYGSLLDLTRIYKFRNLWTKKLYNFCIQKIHTHVLYLMQTIASMNPTGKINVTDKIWNVWSRIETVEFINEQHMLIIYSCCGSFLLFAVCCSHAVWLYANSISISSQILCARVTVWR